MSFRQSFAEVLDDAKRAFESIERTDYEKSIQKNKEFEPYLKSIGFVGGFRDVLVYRKEELK